jgi:hypothetical protein
MTNDIETRRAVIADIEAAMWRDGFNAALLPDYQAAWRRLEDLIAASGHDERHDFVLVIPVADRPQHLLSCLTSILELCRAFGYGGTKDGAWRKVSVLVADDSVQPENIASNLELARQFSGRGLATTCLTPGEQFDLVASLGEETRSALSRVIGNAPREAYGHKGQGVMRNIANLALAARGEAGRKVLYYSLDSDQEFKVKVATAEGDLTPCAVNFFFHLDELFGRSDTLVLTGKVVGDPPVSPAVMTGNFLEDVLGFLQASSSPTVGPCRHHGKDARREGEAAYHDMADLFGFDHKGKVYHYPCPLKGEHTDGDCFDHFAGRLNSFFYGEHPTRASYYVHDDVMRTVQPARTVYAGNYVFRPEALPWFIPFAALRLRMSGPTLGRLLKAGEGGRFVSANLPMLHNRTVEGTGQSEFRPGIHTETSKINFGGEFERQFQGDVMLFSVERLTAAGYPGLPEADIAATLDAMRSEMLEKYNSRRLAIMEKLGRIRALLHDAAQWWNAGGHEAALAHFQAFLANVERNFGDESRPHLAINSPENWAKWRAELLAALVGYPRDRENWAKALAALAALGQP